MSLEVMHHHEMVLIQQPSSSNCMMIIHRLGFGTDEAPARYFIYGGVSGGEREVMIVRAREGQEENNEEENARLGLLGMIRGFLFFYLAGCSFLTVLSRCETWVGFSSDFRCGGGWLVCGRWIEG